MVKELVWETFFRCLEFGAFMSDVVSVVGTQITHFQGHWKILGSIEIINALHLVWVVSSLGFNHCTSIFQFHSSPRFDPWFFVTVLRFFVFIIVNVRFREVGNIDALATILRCRVGSLPMKYLEMPLGTPYKTASIWNPILERMEKKLSSLKRLYLSKGGTLTLLKNTLFRLPTYYLSLFVILVAVADRWAYSKKFFMGIFGGVFQISFGGLAEGV